MEVDNEKIDASPTENVEVLYEIRLVQEMLECAGVPNVWSYGFGKGIDGKNEVVADLLGLATTWNQGADRLAEVAAEFFDTTDVENQTFFIKELDRAIKVAESTVSEIECIAAQIANMAIDPEDEWISNAEDLISQLGCMELYIRLYDNPVSEAMYGLAEIMPPYANGPDPETDSLPPPLTHQIKKWLVANTRQVEKSLSVILMALPIILFPISIGYSFLSLTAAAAIWCWYEDEWDNYLGILFFFGAIYGCLIFWISLR